MQLLILALLCILVSILSFYSISILKRSLRPLKISPSHRYTHTTDSLGQFKESGCYCKHSDVALRFPCFDVSFSLMSNGHKVLQTAQQSQMKREMCSAVKVLLLEIGSSHSESLRDIRMEMNTHTHTSVGIWRFEFVATKNLASFSQKATIHQRRLHYSLWHQHSFAYIRENINRVVVKAYSLRTTMGLWLCMRYGWQEIYR